MKTGSLVFIQIIIIIITIIIIIIIIMIIIFCPKLPKWHTIFRLFSLHANKQAVRVTTLMLTLYARTS